MKQGPHAMLPGTTHDEAAREGFCVAFGDMVMHSLPAGARAAWQHRVVPAFQRQHGRPPSTRQEARRALEADPFGRLASSLRRLSQEVLWDTVCDSIERDLPDLVRRAHRLRAHSRGSLALDPRVTIPRYLGAIDIHAMPGNYDEERLPDDVFAGALYDRGVFLRNSGARGLYNERVGTQLAEWLAGRRPPAARWRLLEIGCAVGGTTLGLAAGLPGTEIHAIDVAAPMLRYAHARAESLGHPIHFSQRNAEHTGWPDGHFDVVCSFALLHETSTPACQAILRESHRLLAPGGLMVHLDNPHWRQVDLFEAAYRDWGTHYNAEPFMGKFGEIDEATALQAAGFRPEGIFEVRFAGARTPSSRFAAQI